jgi:hypothetical protein
VGVGGSAKRLPAVLLDVAFNSLGQQVSCWCVQSVPFRLLACLPVSNGAAAAAAAASIHFMQSKAVVHAG